MGALKFFFPKIRNSLLFFKHRGLARFHRGECLSFKARTPHIIPLAKTCCFLSIKKFKIKTDQVNQDKQKDCQ